MKRFGFAAALLAALIGIQASAAEPLRYPDTPRRPVGDRYHGVEVVDDYRWLEQTDAAEARDWVAAQNRLTRTVLDADPRRTAIRDELKAMLGSGRAQRSAFQFAGGRLFAMKREPPANQSVLVMLEGSASVASERIVVDPNRIDPSGKTTIDWYVPSHDGTHVAVSLSKNGSEVGTLHVYETAGGAVLGDLVPRVQNPTAGGSAAWTADGKGLFYTRYPTGDGFHQQVWFHRLGTPVSQDRYVIGREFPRIAEIMLEASDDGRHLLAEVRNGDGGEHAFWLRSARGSWRRVADFRDGVKRAAFGRDGRLYALAFAGSPRGRIVAMKVDAAGATLTKTPTVVPESEAVVEDFLATRARLYVEEIVGGPSRLRVLTTDGKPLGTVGDAVASVHLGTRLAADAILYGSQSPVRDFAWYRLDPAVADGQALKEAPGRSQVSLTPAAGGSPLSGGPGGAQKTDLSQPQVFALGGGLPGVEAVRDVAVSKDGTRVPTAPSTSPSSAA